MSIIIKADSSELQRSTPAVHQAAFNFDDMGDRANQYLDQVRGEAAKILQEAQQQANTIRQQAEVQGRQAALKAVEQITDERIVKHMQTLLPALQDAVQGIQHAKQAWMDQWQRNAVKVATAIAERVIRRELSQQPEITLDLVKEAIELAAGSAEISIHLNPNDKENLGRQADQLTGQFHQLAEARVVADPHITPGGCRVETKFGSIDQQIESQLQRIEEELT